MTIQGKRIIKLDKYLQAIERGTDIVLGLSRIDRYSSKLNRIGFNHIDRIGETILPPPDFGPKSRFNSVGMYIRHRNQPMETAYYQREWHWKEWRGRDDTVERSKIVDVPYKRYPRTFVDPPSIELTINHDTEGNLIITTPSILYTNVNSDNIIHRINLFLEIFGEVEIFTDNLERIIRAPLHRVNWEILPSGEMPWESLERAVRPIINRARPGNRVVIRDRLQNINLHNPDFYALGRGGFRGYIVFGFRQHNLFVLESIFEGNATYVFGDNWETLSKRTKAEILDNNLQEDRIIHRESWYNRIKQLLEVGDH